MSVFQGAWPLEAAPRRSGAAAPAPSDAPLESLTVRQLVSICADRKIDTPSKPRKADLIAAIRAAGGE